MVSTFCKNFAEKFLTEIFMSGIKVNAMFRFFQLDWNYEFYVKNETCRNNKRNECSYSLFIAKNCIAQRRALTFTVFSRPIYEHSMGFLFPSIPPTLYSLVSGLQELKP